MAQPPAPPPKRWGRWIALGSAVLVLACVGVVALVMVAVPRLRPDSSAPTATASPKPGPAKSPQEGDPPAVFEAWATEKVGEALARQRTALLAADEAGYLSILDPEIPAQDRETVVHQFRSLQAMKVAEWTIVSVSLVTRGEDTWGSSIISSACFVSAKCEVGPVLSNVAWRVEGSTATVIGWKPDAYKSMPWQLSELVAASGSRTVVATTEPFADQLPEILAMAEDAATTADRFARNGDVPSRYVIYYAGTEEWTRWFTWNPPEWAGGGAIDLSDDRYELILNADVLGSADLEYLLRHEMAHASSLKGEFRDNLDLWWLIEGLAGYAELEGHPAAFYPGLEAVSEMLDDRQVTGLEVDAPTATEDPQTVSGRYAVAFLGVRCIAERYGESKMVDFFHRVVHDRATKAAAADDVLGIEWDELDDQCFDYIKEAAG